MTGSVMPSMLQICLAVLAMTLCLNAVNGDSALYTRWGRKGCPTGANLVYSGYVGWSHYGHRGGAANPLCLPRNPQWGLYTDGFDGYKSYVFGAEYHTHTLRDWRKSLGCHDIPCAVCKVKRKSIVMMLPARRYCYGGWRREYTGYLMAGYYNDATATKYVCIDAYPQKVHGGHACSKTGMRVVATEAACGSLKCPPYVQGRELTCVVCSSN